MDGRPVYIELAGNLVPVQKSGEQLHLNFHAFHENRLPFFVRMRDQTQEPCGRLSFMREPRVQRGLPPQVPVCNLNVTMPAYVKVSLIIATLREKGPMDAGSAVKCALDEMRKLENLCNEGVRICAFFDCVLTAWQDDCGK